MAPRPEFTSLAEPAEATPLYLSLLAWTQQRLGPRGYRRPFCKRLALLLAGLLAGERASVAGLAAALGPLAITPAQEPSIARRLARLLDDPRLAPERVLPDLLATVVPALLHGAVQAHAANAALPPAAHQRFRPVQLVLDESSVDERTHVLLVGLVVGGVVLPLGLRTWPQNQPLPADAYWTAVGGLLWEVHALLPPDLRDHVLVLADRAYGVPRLLDLCGVLGWAYVVRVQGQAVVCLADGTTRRARDLAPHPGATWWGGAAPTAGTGADDAPLRIFKKAGWRLGRVVADWAPGEPEPWLLLTNLPSAPERVREYARRWAIERTFLSWKSHGWHLEGCGLPAGDRLGRLLTGLALATLWRLACALPAVQPYLVRTPTATGGPPRTWQPRLPGLDARHPRPWAAKFSLLTWGRKALAASQLRTTTPARTWTLPDWAATATWSTTCQGAPAP